ncbi:hypothetical protein BASA60_003543 [Batrachochytrium salamandrivorans]|nr:hypothetical protein BASA60_003543 [Batrachochytrium salamandrivorans]KAH9272652.1 hypothetical protein BASA83_005158 [Batrachochytrium salamandrivorans]
MQLFHLFSFVVVASYAAALPQPAELSGKYSNSANTNLVSGLEARSYQPGFNSQKGSATLMSLKRRADSKGLPGKNGKYGSSPLPVTTASKPFGDPFKDSDVSSENLFLTIENVEDGNVEVFKDGELAGNKIGGNTGRMMAKYLRRYVYVSVALRRWEQTSVSGILGIIKSGLGDAEYSKVEPGITKRLKALQDEFRVEFDAVVGATTDILRDVGLVGENFQKFNKLFEGIYFKFGDLLSELNFRLRQFKAGKAFYVHLTKASVGMGLFFQDQDRLYEEITRALGTAPSQ